MPFAVRKPRPPRPLELSERNERLLFALGLCALVILGGFIAYKILAFLSSVPIFTFVSISALFFAFLIHPVIAWLNRRMPPAASILVVYAAIVLLLAFIVYIISPVIASDAQSAAANAPKLVAAGQRILTDAKDPLTTRLPGPIRDYLHDIPLEIEQGLSGYAASLAQHTLPLLFSLVSLLAMFIIVPATAAYMTVEATAIRRGFLAVLPASARLRAARIIVDLDNVVGGFIRGQILVAITVGLLMTLLLLGLRVPYAVLIGVFAGTVDVIPYVGAIAGWLPAFLIAYLTNGLTNALAVTLGIVIINQLEGNVIAPNVVSRTVALTPLGVLLALLLVGEILGPVGLFIAIPAAGVLRVLIINFTGMPRHAERAAPRTRFGLPRLLQRLIVHHD